MGGNSDTTTQGIGNQLSSLFQNNGGYNTGQQGQATLPTIQAPQYPTQGIMTPQQAAAATMARMQARTPAVTQAAPVTAPKVEYERDRNNGDSHGRGY